MYGYYYEKTLEGYLWKVTKEVKTEAVVKTILVVDPDAEIVNLLELVLKDNGYGITSAQSLAEAVALLSGSSFDLVITEAFKQDNQTTFDPNFLTELRMVGGTTPIILMSTYVTNDMIGNNDAGLILQMPKPFHVEQLEQAVNGILIQETTAKSG